MKQLGLFALGATIAAAPVAEVFSTRVVNLRREAYDVYIGRAGQGLPGTFGNPVAVGRPCPRCRDGTVHVGSGDTLGCFRAYFDERIARDAVFRLSVEGLRGKALGCFCRPVDGFRGVLRCHGQIIAGWLEGVDPCRIP